MHYIFNISDWRKDKTKYPLGVGKLKLYKAGGDLFNSYDAVTGGWAAVGKKNGALNAGDYLITGVVEIPDNPKYRGEKRSWYAILEPQFDLDRDGLLMHVDEGIIGTLGCCGIQKHEPDDEIYLQAKQTLTMYKKPIPFTVVYSVQPPIA